MAKALVEVVRGRKPGRRPVWLMRQAGRYLPEYRSVRQTAGSFLNLCYRPEMAAEVTLQPLRRYDLDAAIVFADILVVPHALGCELDFVEQEGPVLSVVRDMAGVEALRLGDEPWQFERVYETLSRVKLGLDDKTTLIGFCGAPWTVASYMVEGRGSDRKLALAAARDNPLWFQALMNRLVEVSISYLVGQLRAGAEVLQIFDSWAGDLPENLRVSLVHDPIARIVSGVRLQFPETPVIVFGRGIGSGHDALARATGANAVSVEQDEDMVRLLKKLPHDVAVQGNLSPLVLRDGGGALIEGVEQICSAMPASRHIFNLGHGIVQQTPPENICLLLDTIRRVDGAAG
ncbi:MAG: uroporphyrinogen decarboxylase [Phyllobacteriaceae bacterium]|nr:uroporphyrinogen decarboxylase [Phyllobacteriaceae bacterium]